MTKGEATAAPPGDQELDAVTLARARRGDADARVALVRRYEARVFAALQRLGMGDRTPDLAQETFLRVFRALPEFGPTGPARLSTWILTIATRLAIDELRRRRSTSLADPEAVPGRERTDEQVERRLLGAALEAALRALDPTQRAIVVLRDYHGLGLREIGIAVDLDVPAVRNRLFRARRRLRDALTKGGWSV